MKNRTWHKTKLERRLLIGFVKLIEIEGNQAVISDDGINRKYVSLKYIPQDAIPGDIITLKTSRISSNYIASSINYKKNNYDTGLEMKV